MRAHNGEPLRQRDAPDAVQWSLKRTRRREPLGSALVGIVRPTRRRCRRGRGVLPERRGADVARSLVEAQGDYLFVLKANHRLLYRQVQNAFEGTGTGVVSHHEGHGRREERRVLGLGVEELGLDDARVGQWPELGSGQDCKRWCAWNAYAKSPKAKKRARTVAASGFT